MSKGSSVITRCLDGLWNFFSTKPEDSVELAALGLIGSFLTAVVSPRRAHFALGDRARLFSDRLTSNNNSMEGLSTLALGALIASKNGTSNEAVSKLLALFEAAASELCTSGICPPEAAAIAGECITRRSASLLAAEIEDIFTSRDFLFLRPNELREVAGKIILLATARTHRECLPNHRDIGSVIVQRVRRNDFLTACKLCTAAGMWPEKDPYIETVHNEIVELYWETTSDDGGLFLCSGDLSQQRRIRLLANTYFVWSIAEREHVSFRLLEPDSWPQFDRERSSSSKVVRPNEAIGKL